MELSMLALLGDRLIHNSSMNEITVLYILLINIPGSNPAECYAGIYKHLEFEMYLR